MYRPRRNKLFLPLALALLVSGTVAALSNAGQLLWADAIAGAARAATLGVAGSSHGALEALFSWPYLMASLTIFCLIAAATIRNLRASHALIAALIIVGGLIVLSAGFAWRAAIDLPVSTFAIATFVFAGCQMARGAVSKLRSQGVRRRRSTDSIVRHIIEHRILGIITISGRGMIGSMNPAAQVMLGYGATDLSGTHVRHLFPQVFAGADEKCGLDSILNIDGGAFETHAIRFGGDKIPVEVTVARLPTESGTTYSAFIRDLTVFRNQQRVLEHQALHDSLTGLPNRALFMRRLEDAVDQSPARGRKPALAVLLLDLDRFKEVNNTLGHNVGDRALATLANRLSNALPKEATLARLGGDEFAVLLTARRHVSGAETIAGRIRAALEESIDIDDIRLELDGSVGIALWPQHANCPAQVMQRADIAMYVAKQTPARIALYDATRDGNSLRRLTLSGDLRRAVREGQLFLQYQPKVDLKSRQLAGVEALVRWRHPEYGAVSPDDFIEHAELTGAIVPLSEWVLSTAINRCAAWNATGLDIDVAVNLSARLLLYPDLVDVIETELTRAGLAAKRLVIEVTESALMSDPESTQFTLSALKALGVRLAIDDYGTGYSSLAYLSDLNADELKIDKRFVQSAMDNPNDRTIVESTVQLAHNLGLKVVAEGMEDERTYRYLRRLGCEIGQGYYFAKPLPEDELVAWTHSAQKGSKSRPTRKPRMAKRRARENQLRKSRRKAASAR